MDEIYSKLKFINKSATHKTSKFFMMMAATNGFLATAFGAFGAHALKSVISSEMLAVYQTGVQYQFYHSLALLLLSLIILHYDNTTLKAAGWLFLLGIVLFSGSLYLLAVTGVKYLGIITPFGGATFILGWFALVIGGSRSRQISE